MKTEIRTGPHVGDSENRRKIVEEAGGGVIDWSQLSAEERAKKIKEQEEAAAMAEKKQAEAEVSTVLPNHVDMLKKFVDLETGEHTGGVAGYLVADDPTFIPEGQNQSGYQVLKANIEPNAAGVRMVKLPSRASFLVDCGFRMAMEAGWEAEVRITDFWAEKGLVITSPPIRNGERVKVMVTNIAKEIVDINHCSPIALIKPVPAHYFVWSPVSNLVDHYKKASQPEVGVDLGIDEPPLDRPVVAKKRPRRKKKSND